MRSKKAHLQPSFHLLIAIVGARAVSSDIGFGGDRVL